MESFAILTIVIFIIMALIPLTGVFFFIRWVIKKGTHKPSLQDSNYEQQQMLARVDFMKKDLAPWGNRHYSEISSAMQTKFSKGMSARRLIGTVYSIKNEPILAFSRVERGFGSDGHFFVGSTNFNLAYKVVSDNFEIILNNELLGRITNSGQILNPTGYQIGTAVHPTKVSINSGNLRYRFGESKYDVIIAGHKLAEVFVAPNHADFSHGNFSKNYNENAIGQPIIKITGQPSPEDEKWLLAITVLEIVHHGHWMI